MRPHFYDDLPPNWFTRPGWVDVSAAALRLAKDFATELRAKTPSKDWVVGFDWADDRRVRDSKSGRWQVLGAGIDIAAYERHRLPEGCIHRSGDFEFLVKVPETASKLGTNPIIDTDPAEPAKLVLR